MSEQGEEFTLTDEFKEEVERMGGLGALYGLYRADPWADKDEKTGIVPGAFRKSLQYGTAIRHRAFPPRHPDDDEQRSARTAIRRSEAVCFRSIWLPVQRLTRNFFLEGYRACGKQLKSGHVELALMSALDVARDPRWGRSEECYSEDPCLAAAMAKAAVTGMQSTGVGSVAKHFCAQGETTGGVNASAARIGERELQRDSLSACKSVL